MKTRYEGMPSFFHLPTPATAVSGYLKDKRLFQCLCLFFLAPLVASAAAGIDASKIEYHEAFSSVAVTSLSGAGSSTGTVVNVTFSNSSGQDQTVHYRLNWLGSSGKPIVQGEPWNVVTVAAHSDKSVSASTSNPNVADYRIQLSLGKNF